jgi:type I restriction enzyme, S subunit
MKTGEAFMTGSAGQKRVPTSFIENFLVALPPLSEQRQIAHFLDHKTAQIDAAIEKGRRLIELLREERAALINEAVTAGVDEHGRPRTKPTQLPAEGWKDSGVEWLGAVPEEWEVVKLKRIAEVRSGVTKSGAKKINDPVEIPYLRVANVQDGYLDLSNVSKMKIASRSIPNLLLQKGDLLMNEGGDNDKLGRGCIWNEEISPCTHQNHVFAVRPHPNINSKWLNAVTFTQYARNYFISNAKQSTNLASISSTSIKNLAIVLPSKIEQQRILRYIETETTRIDQKTTTMEQEIELLTEYRQALISEAVTGKIDVRNITVDGEPNEGATV